MSSVFTPLAERVKALELLTDRAKALEARPAVRHCGVYVEGKVYRENSLTTRNGGMWIAVRDTRDSPGSEGGGWQLVVKAGKA